MNEKMKSLAFSDVNHLLLANLSCYISSSFDFTSLICGIVLLNSMDADEISFVDTLEIFNRVYQ